MKTDDLHHSGELDTGAIDRVAMLLYSNHGKEAVLSLAKLLEWEEFGDCDVCDDPDVPVLAGHCMICGGEITTIQVC